MKVFWGHRDTLRLHLWVPSLSTSDSLLDSDIISEYGRKVDYYPYMAFVDQNKIVYST